MRRLFPRIPGSPQAPAIVETPAHNTPTLFLQVGSSVRGGEWECQSQICHASFGIQCKDTNKFDKLFIKGRKITFICMRKGANLTASPLHKVKYMSA